MLQVQHYIGNMFKIFEEIPIEEIIRERFSQFQGLYLPIIREYFNDKISISKGEFVVIIFIRN